MSSSCHDSKSWWVCQNVGPISLQSLRQLREPQIVADAQANLWHNYNTSVTVNVIICFIVLSLSEQLKINISLLLLIKLDSTLLSLSILADRKKKLLQKIKEWPETWL